MRHAIQIALLLAVVFMLLGLPAAEAANSSAVKRLYWMSGCWQQVDAERGTGEMWTKVSGNSVFGVSRTVRSGETVTHEFMRIEPDVDGAVYLIALPAGQSATRFRLTHVDDREVVFENPEHDFPQRISYMNEGLKRLVAVIEGPTSVGEKRVEYPMNRVSCQ